jgi:hypothetical protein
MKEDQKAIYHITDRRDALSNIRLTLKHFERRDTRSCS